MRLHSNKYVEALLYVTIPLAVHVALTPRLLRRALRHTRALVLGHPDKGFVVREIAATTTFHTWRATVSKADELNHMLQRALAEFIVDKLELEADRTNTVYQLLDKPFDEQHLAHKAKPDDDASNTSGVDTDDDQGSDDDDDDDYYMKKDYSYEQLLQLRVAAAPAAETWAQVAPGVFFQYVVSGAGDASDEEPQDDRNGRRVTMTFRLRSKRADASQAIDAIVQQAFFEYKKRQVLKSAQDTTRYLFVQTVKEQPKQLKGDDGSDSVGGKSSISVTQQLVFKRYPLGEGKSFKNLFFQDKPRILHLLDNFTQRRGKFAVKGFPYKLGLLLHGPPGTGKTSLIKAVAQYTKRHIVSISLAKIKTNQELMDAMFDLRFPIEGRATPIVLDFQDVVFVMEDIDCAGASVVNARNAIDQETKARPRRRIAAATQANDKLNLSGLLNVLDGVIDCPGRIVIMTTNHPEKLDPALIRPGRVNAQLLLGPMAGPQIVEMLEYYFSATMTLTEKEQVEEATHDAVLTPAEVEEICAEHDTLDDAFDALRRVTTK